MASWDVGCSGCSRRTPSASIAITAPQGTSGRGASRPFPSGMATISLRCSAMSSAMRCGAELVSRAEDWKWSSLTGWRRDDPLLWQGEEPVRDERWLDRVNEPLSGGDLQRLRHSVSRGRPCGRDAWTRETAIRLGLSRPCIPRDDRVRRTCKSSYVPHFCVLVPRFCSALGQKS